MKIQELLIPELQQELAITEKFLGRIPEDKLEWRPHEKSMSIRELGNHLAEIPNWITATMETDEMVMDNYKATEYRSVKEMVESLRENALKAEASLKKPDEEYLKNWKMIMGGKTVMDLPKLNVLRSMVLNQIPHHRAQLGVYFRLLDISVPTTYGPSADEN